MRAWQEGVQILQRGSKYYRKIWTGGPITTGVQLLRDRPSYRIASKLTQMSAHPGVSFVWLMKRACEVWEAQPWALCISEVRNFVLKVMVLQVCFAKTNVANAACSMGYTMSSWWHGAVQSVVCRQNVTLKPMAVPLYVIVHPITCFESLQTWHGCILFRC